MYSAKYDRWYPMVTIKTYQDINYQDYAYIFGDKIFREHSEEAEQAFNSAKMWSELKQRDTV